MQKLVETFQDGGIWMYAIILWGAVFFSLLVVQFRRRADKDFTWVLWGILISLFALGPLGTAVGIHQSAGALASMSPPDPTSPVVLVWKIVGIALTTTIFSTLLAVVGAIPLGVVTYQVRNGKRPA
jgi:hypothetical protein